MSSEDDENHLNPEEIELNDINIKSVKDIHQYEIQNDLRDSDGNLVEEDEQNKINHQLLTILKKL